VTNGFIREPCGNIAEFDAPEPGGTPGLGTRATSINPEGVIAGDYVAYGATGQSVDQGFVRIPACNHGPSEEPQQQ
jgi:hypothetical protein